MQKYLILLILPILLLGCSAQTNNLDPEKLYFFYSDTCPHCHDALQYIDSAYPNLKMSMVNVTNNTGLELLLRCARKFKLGNSVGTPLFCLKDKYVMGWSAQNQKLFDELVKTYTAKE